jgi:hypothetical protein
VLTARLLSRSRRSLYVGVSSAMRRVNGWETVLTGIAGNSRRDGRSASEEAFEKIGHGIGALVKRACDREEEIPRCMLKDGANCMVRAPGERGAGLAWRRGDCKRMSIRAGKKYLHIRINNGNSEIEHESMLLSWMYCGIKFQKTDRSQAPW